VRYLHRTTIPGLALLAAGAVAFAQSSGGDFEVSRSVVADGGATSTAPAFELTGSIAQPEADPAQSVGGEYALAGGFWGRATDAIFDSGFEG